MRKFLGECYYMNCEEKNMKLKYTIMGSDTHLSRKKNRMQELKKVRIQKKINNSREYLIVANRISGQKRIESREKINKLLAEKNKRVTTLKEEHENGEQSYKYNN